MNKIRKLIGIAVIAAVVVMGITITTCDNNTSDNKPETVATPTAAPPAGTYDATQTVTLSTTTEGATIYYTLNGNAPTVASTQYSSAITIPATSTLKAIAVKSGMANSGILTAAYTINIPSNTVVTPTANPPAGTYNADQTVTLSSTTPGATIYYTLDGNDPTETSTQYSSAITINQTTTLKAIAKKSGMTDSSILTAVYTINLTFTAATLIQDNSVVSLVKSTTVTQASNFDYTEILAMTREAIELAGGLDGIVKPGDVVVLKPNVIVVGWNWSAPSIGGNHIPELVNGVCTDRRVIQAVAQIVREIVGPYDPGTGKGKIMVIEGSGKGSTADNFANLGYNLTNFANVDEIIALEDEGAWVWPANDPSGTIPTAAASTHNTQVTLPQPFYTSAVGSNTYRRYYNNDGIYYANKKMLEADALICIPVVKSHWNAVVTGSIKNIGIGATPPTIYGIAGNDVGRNNMVDHGKTDLMDWISDYFSVLPADFVVMDGLQGVEDGPLPSGTAAELTASQKNLRCILASRDPLAIDTAMANIIGWDYAKVRYLVNLAGRGEVFARGEIGKPNPRKITLRGDPKNIVVLGNKKVDDVRGDYEARGYGDPVNVGGEKISMAQKALPTVTIHSAEFSGANLAINLSRSIGAYDNVVKLDVYIDGVYKNSFDPATASNVGISLDASSLAAGSHSIEVRAFTRYMYSATATTTAVK